jgi:phosphoadenosine phosphosulfate reductase
MSVTIVHTLIEETKEFSIEETFAFLANEYKDKVVFSTLSDKRTK